MALAEPPSVGHVNAAALQLPNTSIANSLLGLLESAMCGWKAGLALPVNVTAYQTSRPDGTTVVLRMIVVPTGTFPSTVATGQVEASTGEGHAMHAPFEHVW